MPSARPRSMLPLVKSDISIKLLFCSRSRNEVMMILRRNPNFDLDVLRRQFPDVNVDKLRNEDKIRGHYVPKVGVSSKAAVI